MPKDLNDQLTESMAQLRKQLADLAFPKFSFTEHLAMPTMPKFDPDDRYDSARNFISNIHETVRQWRNDPQNAGETAISLVMQTVDICLSMN